MARMTVIEELGERVVTVLGYRNIALLSLLELYWPLPKDKNQTFTSQVPDRMKLITCTATSGSRQKTRSCGQEGWKWQGVSSASLLPVWPASSQAPPLLSMF